MSLLVLFCLLLISLALTACFDVLPELLISWLSPPRWVGWVAIVAIVAWLAGE
ncbi:hypothetical protein [Almyronema epifaneia]|uniref:Uncharacterized protein n=1 Tax=Almyronema epifaneia S1 TaxID=2991925 RepID=A0ABW6IF77_9CYAN